MIPSPSKSALALCYPCSAAPAVLSLALLMLTLRCRHGTFLRPCPSLAHSCRVFASHIRARALVCCAPHLCAPCCPIIALARPAARSCRQIVRLPLPNQQSPQKADPEKPSSYGLPVDVW